VLQSGLAILDALFQTGSYSGNLEIRLDWMGIHRPGAGLGLWFF
jgi:hypothetical protein